MKYTCHILSCTILYSSLLFASERNDIPLVSVYHKRRAPTTTQKTTDQLALDIDAKINEKYSHNAFTDFFSSLRLPEDAMVDILNTVSQLCPHEDQVVSLTAMLCEKNIFFKTSVYDFTGKALDNIKKATSNTIAIIENPMLQQPEPALNRLSPLLKNI